MTFTSNIDVCLQAALTERRLQNRYRQPNTVTASNGVLVQIDGRDYLNFSSNDYLGLAQNHNVAEALQQAAAKWGVGSGASHLINGHSAEHQLLEEELAAFTGRERALLFSTGYMANLGTIQALVGKGDVVLQDKLNHASLLDAGLASGARCQRYRHSDLNHLEQLLQKPALQAPNGRRLIVTDGVFSMDGDVAPLQSLAELAAAHNAWLMVDDAHGLGVLGATGAGCAEAAGLSVEQLPILMGTLGKAFGTFGAFVAGSAALIDTLIQFARPYVYTTAMPPAVAAASRASLQQVRSGADKRQRLQRNIDQFRRGAHALNIPLMASDTAIQPVVLGDEARTLKVAAQLKQKGFLVGAIRPPTVAVGVCRLRVTLSAAHTHEHIEQLLQQLGSALVLER